MTASLPPAGGHAERLVTISYDQLDAMSRADLPPAPAALASAADEWLHREHGIIASHHHVGHLLQLLHGRGYCVMPLPPAART